MNVRYYRTDVQGRCPRCDAVEAKERKPLPSDVEGAKAWHCLKCDLDFCEICDDDGNFDYSEGSGVQW